MTAARPSQAAVERAIPPTAYVPARWVALRLGLHPDSFRRARPKLEAAGLPTPDPLFGRYLVDDVEAWIRKRRRVAEPESTGTDREIDIDSL